MNKWQKMSIVLSVLLLLSCVMLGAISVFWLANGGASSVLAAVAGNSLAPVPTPPTVGTLPGSNGGAGGNLANRLAGSFGTVQSVNGSQITVGLNNGAARTITLAPNARVIIAGMPNAAASDIKVGDKLLVFGLGQSQSMTAQALVDAPASYTASNLRVGQLQAVSGQTLSINTRQGKATIQTDSSTQVYGPGLQALQPDSLPIGQNVIVIGQPNAAIGFQAQLIIVANSAAVNTRLPRNRAGQPPLSRPPSMSTGLGGRRSQSRPHL